MSKLYMFVQVVKPDRHHTVVNLQQVEITADNASNGELESELLSGLAVKKVQLLGVGSEMR